MLMDKSSPTYHTIKDILIPVAIYLAALYPKNTIIDIANSICTNFT